MAQRDQLKYIGHDCTQLIFNYTSMIDRLHIISTCKYLYNKEHVATLYYTGGGGYYYNDLNRQYDDFMNLKEEELHLSNQIVILEKILNQRKMQLRNLGNVLFRYKYPTKKSGILFSDLCIENDGTYSRVRITFKDDILPR